MLLARPRPDPPPDLGPRRRGRSVAAGAAVVLLLVLSVPTVSYGRALLDPTSTDWQTTTVEWVRDHGGGPLVDVAENWWYSRRRPADAAPDPGTLPTVVAAPTPARVGPAPLPTLRGVPPLPHEGEWTPQTPGLATAYFRPDPAFPGQIAGAAWMDQDLVTTHLFAGTAEPVPGTPAAKAQVPTALRSSLVAVFNAGWKMRDSRGGFYTSGATLVPLRDGAASLVIDTAGRVTVGQWGRDVRMGPAVTAVRQNLDLVVDGGRPVAGLHGNATGAWGSPKNQFQYTWRSGIGTDRRGNLVYVAGDQLTLAGLADAMVTAGVQRGMELDIHPKTVSFSVLRPTTRTPPGLDASKLLPAMVSPAGRYLVPDHRDFFAVTRRG